MTRPTLEELIEAKRDGERHEDAEIEHLVEAFVSGEMPDYQMAAWLMATCLNGLDEGETVALTRAMAASGRVVDLSSIEGRKADKHSTGSVGDKTTLVVAPLVAACGVPVAKMSGRGLGHTGGTLDKLESIPGMSVDLEESEFLAQVARIGVAVVSQSADVDPADKKMYGLRDVTGTVPSIPLIVGSIISKKVAGGADVIVLDVKVGSGAFMRTAEEATALAAALTATAAALGKDVSSVMSAMDRPLGRAVGNALEVAEAVDTLSGDGADELSELSIALASRMMSLARGGGDAVGSETDVRRALASGGALERFALWVEAQGGDPVVIEGGRGLPRAAVTREITADRAATLLEIDTERVGRAAMVMGAGRATKDSRIDLAAGIVFDVQLGDEVTAGERLATLHASSVGLLDEGEARLAEALVFGEGRAARLPLLLEG